MNNLKLKRMDMSALNGKIFFTLNNDIIIINYVTPLFNDYNEWRIETFSHYKDVAHTIKENELLFEIETTNINSIKLMEIINQWDLENINDIELRESDGIMIGEIYREPTEEEMKIDGMRIKEYSIGNYITALNGRNTLINMKDKLQEDNEVLNLSFNILSALMENKDSILKLERTIFM